MTYMMISSTLLQKPVVMIGMMGAGKTTVGRKLAALLHVSFADSDREIEKAAGMTVSDIFSHKGEAEFRRVERLVITRLLAEKIGILSVGGGAFIQEDVRALIKSQAYSLWLTADPALLLERSLRHGARPLLQVDDPKAKMESLLAARTPYYAEADMQLVSDHQSSDITAQRALDVLGRYLDQKTRPSHPKDTDSDLLG